MVVITIVAQNGETIFFDEPLPKVHFMKLISCSLYNSWDTLKRESTVILSDQRDASQKKSKIPPGHYNLEGFKKLIDGLFNSSYNKLEAEIFTPKGVIKINNYGNKIIGLSGDFAYNLGGRNSLETITNIKSLSYPTSYFIHCDLIDKNFNFINNKKSDLLAKIDVKGRPYEKVRYDAAPQQPIRDCSTSSHVNSITISVRDQDGELFDFKDMPLEFELDLN